VQVRALSRRAPPASAARKPEQRRLRRVEAEAESADLDSLAFAGIEAPRGVLRPTDLGGVGVGCRGEWPATQHGQPGGPQATFRATDQPGSSSATQSKRIRVARWEAQSVTRKTTMRASTKSGQPDPGANSWEETTCLVGVYGSASWVW
jgi:hypothetical protein